MKRSHPALLQKLRDTPVNQVCISVITRAELLYGAEKSPNQKQDREAVDAFLRHAVSLEFLDDAACHYAQIRWVLRQTGKMIGSNDLFIAAHARSLCLTMVTNNTREFGRVPSLKVENWT